MNRTILIEALNILTNWNQNRLIHCPDKNCDGMLLESEDTYTFKCSNCNCYWDEFTEWKKV